MKHRSIKPKHLNGNDDLYNLRLVCIKCNKIKAHAFYELFEQVNFEKIVNARINDYYHEQCMKLKKAFLIHFPDIYKELYYFFDLENFNIDNLRRVVNEKYDLEQKSQIDQYFTLALLLKKIDNYKIQRKQYQQKLNQILTNAKNEIEKVYPHVLIKFNQDEH